MRLEKKYLKKAVLHHLAVVQHPSTKSSRGGHMYTCTCCTDTRDRDPGPFLDLDILIAPLKEP